MPPQTFDSRAFVRTNRAIWIVIAAMMLVLAASYRAAGLSIEIGDGWNMLLAAPFCLLISVYYHYRRSDTYISTGAESAAQLILILLLGALLSFAAATTNLPYRDADLHAFDRWIGFDWRAYLGFFNARPYLGYAVHIAYLTINIQPMLVILALTATGYFLRVKQFVLATGLSLCVTLAAFIFTPAIDNFAFLGLQWSEFANLTPTFSFQHIHYLEALRHGTIDVVRLDDLEGLITFPSFHAISAVLFVWAAWPVRYLKWLICLLNLGLLAATPVDGAHYTIDIVAGILVAIIAICAAIRLQRPFLSALPRPRPVEAVPGIDP